MSQTQHDFVAGQYAPRAADYVTSAVHAAGPDLDQVAAAMAGRAGARVLDLGCGGGHVSYRVAPLVAEVVACDLTPAMLDAVARSAAERGLANITVQQAAAEALPFADAAFDVVLCRMSAHHWHDLAAGLREARRVLRPDGIAILIDTVAPGSALLDTYLQTIELLRDRSHVRNYTLAEWAAALAGARFAITGLTARKLRIEFASWIARTRTPEALAQSIRTLAEGAPAEVRRHFAIGPDGSFDLDAITFELAPA